MKKTIFIVGFIAAAVAVASLGGCSPDDIQAFLEQLRGMVPAEEFDQF